MLDDRLRVEELLLLPAGLIPIVTEGVGHTHRREKVRGGEGGGGNLQEYARMVEPV